MDAREKKKCVYVEGRWVCVDVVSRCLIRKVGKGAVLKFLQWIFGCVLPGC